jgi:tRNA(fMet)-specific endonuclease VapC
VERRPDNPKLRQAVNEFLRRINVLSWDTDTARQYALIRAKLEKVGKPMGNMDILIAAHAVSSGLMLVTNDKVFKNVDNLKIEDWVE